MAMHYSDPRRASDPHALPDIEVYYIAEVGMTDDDESNSGWWWQHCFPGCLPDGDPIGPFATEAEALADARDGIDDDDNA